MTKEEMILQLVKEADPDNPLEYVRNIVKGFAREKLDRYILDCKDCSICNSTKTLTYGSVNASVLVVSEFVLAEQNTKEGSTYPLAGTEAHQILEKTLDFYGFNIDEFFFINAVNCCPSSTASKTELARTIPNMEEKKNCHVFLDYAIQMIHPVFIIILGNIALNHFVRDTVFNVHGKVIQAKGIPAIATYSPEHLLWCRRETPATYEYEKELFLKDFEKIKEYLLQYEQTNLFK